MSAASESSCGSTSSCPALDTPSVVVAATAAPTLERDDSSDNLHTVRQRHALANAKDEQERARIQEAYDMLANWKLTAVERRASGSYSPGRSSPRPQSALLHQQQQQQQQSPNLQLFLSSPQPDDDPARLCTPPASPRRPQSPWNRMRRTISGRRSASSSSENLATPLPASTQKMNAS